MDNTPPSPTDAPSSNIANEVKAEAKNLLGGLADFGFKSFVTPKVPTVLYGLILLTLTYIFVESEITAIRFGSIRMFLLALFSFVISVIMTRVLIELALAVFKILDTLMNIERKQK